jgi:hypothetical protein
MTLRSASFLSTPILSTDAFSLLSPFLLVLRRILQMSAAKNTKVMRKIPAANPAAKVLAPIDSALVKKCNGAGLFDESELNKMRRLGLVDPYSMYELYFAKEFLAKVSDEVPHAIPWNLPALVKLEQLEQHELEETMAKSQVEVEEGVYTCGRCSSRRISNATVQERSGDEGFTVYAACTRCGNKWKFNT